jgi:hypothetical protein
MKLLSFYFLIIPDIILGCYITIYFKLLNYQIYLFGLIVGLLIALIIVESEKQKL